MSTIKFAMFLLYRYYNGSKWEKGPYFHVLCSMSFLLFMHVVTCLCFLKKGELIFGGDQTSFVVKFVLLFLVFLIGFWKVASEKDLKKICYDEKQIKKGNLSLILYIFLSISLLVSAII